MAPNTTQLVFKCLNPECRELIKLPRPAKSGVYSVTCPFCGITKNLNLKGQDAFADSPSQTGGESAKEQAQQCDQKPAVHDNSSNNPVYLKEDFIVGETFKFLCPHCKQQELGMTPQKSGRKEFACPLCHGKLVADVRPKTKIVDTFLPPIINGKLVLLRKGWFNKSYSLPVGKHTIGRYDETNRSEIMVGNDSTMSRRSVEIDVSHTGEKGFRFKLTVLRAANPVLHNNQPLNIGESVSLNFGDSIILGKTKFRFEMDK